MTRAAPQISIYRGFDPSSPTLFVHRARGTCFGEDMPEGRVVPAYDPAVACRAGDIALLAVRTPSGAVVLLGKQLEVARGRVWGVCLQGALPLDALPIVGIAKLVAKAVFPQGWRAEIPPGAADPMSASDRAMMLAISAPALTEWTGRGFGGREWVTALQAAA